MFSHKVRSVVGVLAFIFMAHGAQANDACLGGNVAMQVTNGMYDAVYYKSNFSGIESLPQTLPAPNYFLNYWVHGSRQLHSVYTRNARGISFFSVSTDIVVYRLFPNGTTSYYTTVLVGQGIPQFIGQSTTQPTMWLLYTYVPGIGTVQTYVQNIIAP